MVDFTEKQDFFSLCIYILFHLQLGPKIKNRQHQHSLFVYNNRKTREIIAKVNKQLISRKKRGFSTFYCSSAGKNHCSLLRSRHSLLILVERGRHFVYLGGGELSLKDSKLHSRNICLGSHAKCNISAQDAGAATAILAAGAFKLSQRYTKADAGG